MAEPRVSSAGRGAGRLAWLKAHPILCLALLTPGLPEYLSSSSPLLNLVANPAWFFLGLALNVGQYTGGALLIREAAIRWHKGWATVAFLGLAYGVTEEGLGDNTLFNSCHGADGLLGHFGRFDGVNWVWSAGVLTLHVVVSIGLALLLFGLALPSSRGRSLLGRRGIVTCFATLAAATGVEALLVRSVDGFWMGVPLFVGALLVIVVLVAVARVVPASWGRPPAAPPTAAPSVLVAAGLLLFPAVFVAESVPAALPDGAAVALVAVIGIVAAFLETVRRTIGVDDGHRRACLALGLVVFLAGFGLLESLPFAYTLPLAVLALWFVVRLERAYRPRPAIVPGTAAGGTG